MSPPPARARIDRASIVVQASPDVVYAAFADGEQLMRWLPPGTMTGRLLAYDFREGGNYAIELRYDEATPDGVGKTEGKTDVSRGVFLALEPGRRIVWSVVFASTDAAFAGEMKMTWTFEPGPDGTTVTVVAEDVPSGIDPADHDEGLRGSLENLARWVDR